MEKIYGGMNVNKACLLIALDQMFPNGYEGRDFLHDMFREHFQDIGFPLNIVSIIEECAPVQRLPVGQWNFNYNQGDKYVQIISHTKPIRYLINPNVSVLYMYELNSNDGHAVCIAASLLIWFMNNTKCCDLFLPKPFIRDNVQYKG